MLESLGDKYIYLIVFASGLAAFSTGSALTWSSPVIPKLSNETYLDDNPFGRIITVDEQSWVGSLIQLGGAAGPLLFGYLIDKIGRRLCVMFCGVPLLASFLILAFAKNITLYYIARVIGGIGVGCTFTVAWLYVGEIAEQSKRGLLSSLTTCFIISGLLFSYVVGPYVSIMAFNLILAVFPAVLIVLFGLVGPESPYYLVAKHQDEKARNILVKIRNDHSSKIDEELQDIRLNCEKQQAKGSIWDLFRNKAGLRAFFIACTLFTLQQFSGINVILTYTQSIFQATGSDIDDAVSSIISGSVQLTTCFITPLLTDKLGRRKLLLFSVSGVSVSLAIFGVYFYLKNHKTNMDSISWLPIVVLIVFVLFFNSGFGSLPSVVVGELFPLEVKSVGSALTNFIYFIVGFLLSYYFNGISDAIGIGGMFWIYSGVCGGTVVFIYFFLIETTGKSLQEIQEILSK